MNESNENEELSSHPEGILKILGELPQGTIVSESALAKIFNKHPISIKRAVLRGEIPPSARLMGEPSWTVGWIIRHIENRLENAKREFEKNQKRIIALQN